MKRPPFLAAVAIMPALLLSACNGPDADLSAWVATQQARRPPPLQPLPVLQKFEMFTYTDQALRDPFSASVHEDSGSGSIRPDLKRPKQPLEAFSLDSLKMVGTIGAGHGQQALIQDPTGLIHRVMVGEYLGLNYGQIIVLSGSKVDVKELVPDGSGGWTERAASIALHE